MRNIIFVFLVVSHVLCDSLFAQTAKKEINSWYSQVARANVIEVREGKHLVLAKEYSLENFIEYYVKEGKESFNKKDGKLTIEELYKDSVYIYFGHLRSWGMSNFFKVRQNDLLGVNYEEIDGRQIRKRFIDEIVPASDKRKVEKRSWGCTSFTGIEEFTYKYIKDTKEIEISYKWKSVCDFVAKLINKTYTARYDLDTKMFSSLKFYKQKGKKQKIQTGVH